MRFWWWRIRRVARLVLSAVALAGMLGLAVAQTANAEGSASAPAPAQTPTPGALPPALGGGAFTALPAPAAGPVAPPPPAPGRAWLRGDEARLAGPGYRAELDEKGLELRLVSGSRSAGTDDDDHDDDEAAFRYRLEEIRAGDRKLYQRAHDQRASAWQVQGRTARLDRGHGVTELYDALPIGIEQRFRIDDPLPKGADLRIRGSFASPLTAARVPGRGVVFRKAGPDGRSPEELCYGEATIIDAEGREVPGTLTLNGDHLEISFGGEALEGLSYPIVCDPLLGVNFLIRSTTAQEQNVAICHNSTLNEYLVVWDLYGNGSYDIWGQRVSTSGSLIGSAFAIRNQWWVDERYPSVAYSPSTQRYVLAMTYGSGDVIQTTIGWNGAYVGAWYLDNRRPPTGFSQDPKVVYQSSDTFCFTWSDSDASTPQNQWVLAERRTSNAVTYQDDWQIQSTTGAAAFRHPAVAYDSTDDRFYFAWEHPDASVRSVAISGDLAWYVGPWPNITLASSGVDPAAVWCSTPNLFQVVWSSSNLLPGGDYDLFVQRVHASGADVGETIGGVRIVNDWSLDERHPALAYQASSDEVVAIYDRDWTSDRDMHAQPLRSDGTRRGSALWINSGLYDTQHPAVAASATSLNFLSAWEDQRGTSYDVYAQRLTDTAPFVVASDPREGDTNVPTDYAVTVRFSEAVSSKAWTSSVRLIDQVTFLVVPATVTYQSSDHTAILTPTSNLVANRSYQLQVGVGANVVDLAANVLSPTLYETFTAGSGPGLVDTDGDGLLDAEEALLGTNPALADSDGDGLPDLFEVFSSDPLTADSDGDGESDLVEWINGTNPRDPTSGGLPGYDPIPPEILSFAPPGGAQNVPVTTWIRVAFTEPVNPATVVVGTSFIVENITAIPPTPIAGWVTFENGNRVVAFHPNASLPTSTNIQTTVPGGAGMIADPAGNVLAATKLSSFQTSSGSGAPTLAAQEPLQRPSFGDPTGAGEVASHFGSGDLPANAVGLPGAFYSVSGFGEGCGTCGGTCGVRDGSFGGTGLGIFGKTQSHVSLINGAFVYGRTDWAFSDLSLHAAQFRRTYRSNLVDPSTQAPWMGLFGYRTVSSWETRLLGYTGTGSSFTLLAPDGRFFVMTWNGNGWTLQAGFYGRIYLDATAGLVKLIFRNGLTFAYRTSDGRLSYVRDRNGQQQTLAYTGSQLTSITDATGRVTTVGYNVNGQINTLTFYDGLQISYGYDGFQRLQTVTLPGTDEFPSGRQTSYTYTGNALLLTVQNGRGETVLTNHYDEATGVIQSQDHINGSFFYVYDFGHAGGVLTTCVDRSGNVTDVQHDAAGHPVTITQYSQGLNELDPTAQWVTSFTHDANGEVTKVVHPRGNVDTWTYATNGFVTEHRKKTADVADNDTVDIIERWKTDPSFGVVLRYLEPRANDPATPAAQKVAYAHFYFYDHEDIPARLLVETAELGATVAITGTAQVSYGRQGTGQFPAMTGGVFTDADGDGLTDRGGNLWIDKGPSPRIVDKNTPSQFLSSRQVIESFHSYNQPGFLVIAVDPTGDVARWQYVQGAYNATTNPDAGYLKYQITDSGLTAANLDLITGDPTGGASEPNGHLALTTTYTHDDRGNLLSIRSPRGLGRSDNVFLTRYTYDQNNLLRTRTASDPFAYQWTYSYDGNAMVTEERTPNVLPNDLNGNGIQDGASEQTIQTPAYFRKTYTYCSCNDVLSVTVDDGGLALTTTYGYDESQRRNYVRSPEGNTATTVYDERDLVIRTVQGANDTSQASTVRRVYDANGNLEKVYDDDTDVDTSGTHGTPTVMTYDLFDRATKTTDELGNEREMVYDKASLVVQTIARGPDAPGGANEILAQSFSDYDEAQRVFQVVRDHFDAVGNVALSSGPLTPPVDHSAQARGALVGQVSVYDAEGRAVASIDDNLHKTETFYDQADRVIQVNDPRTNFTLTRYDADSNVIDVQETEQYDVGTGQTFVSRTFYDELGHAIVRVSSLGNAQRVLYGSRGNAVQVADAQADSSGNASALDTYGEHLFTLSWPDVAISGAGNKTHRSFDGANRLVVTTRDLTADGTGSGAAAGSITTQREYDKDSRLTAQIDDNGNHTEYVYDALNRRVIVRNADGTQKLFLYDRANNLRYTKDERGVVSEVTVDILGRSTGVIVSRLPFGPGQETYQVFQYDGLSRVVYAENNHAKVTPRYDSLGPVIREFHKINVGADRSAQADPWSSVVQKTVNAVYDGVGNRTQLVYPGGTTVNETYDVNDRKKLVKDGSTVLADYQYAGPGYRMLEKRLSAGNVTLYRDYDGDRRVTRHDWRRPSAGMRIAGFTYAWDRVGNRWFERTLTNNTNANETAGSGWAFSYDSVYRMRDWYDGAASASLNGVVNNSPRLGVTPSATAKRSYDLDGVGNRSEVVKDGVVEVAYALTAADAQTNQYSRIDDTPQVYDEAGNLLHEGTWRFYYSAKNQLLQAVSWSGDVRYRYGPFGRRVSKRMATGNFSGLSYGHSVYVHFGQDLLEEETTAGALRKEWVYGIRIDEPIRMRAPDTADIDNDFNTTEIVPLYYLTSSIGTVWALVDGSGVAKERYTYDVWGTITDVIDKNGASTGASWTLVGNPRTFTGRQYDFEEQTGLYHYRARAYRPAVGEFLQRDPLGVWGDLANLGGGRQYAASNPVNRTDAFGLEGEFVYKGYEKGATPKNMNPDKRAGGQAVPVVYLVIEYSEESGEVCANLRDHRLIQHVYLREKAVGTLNGGVDLWHEGVHLEQFRKAWFAKRENLKKLFPLKGRSKADVKKQIRKKLHTWSRGEFWRHVTEKAFRTQATVPKEDWGLTPYETEAYALTSRANPDWSAAAKRDGGFVRNAHLYLNVGINFDGLFHLKEK